MEQTDRQKTFVCPPPSLSLFYDHHHHSFISFSLSESSSGVCNNNDDFCCCCRCFCTTDWKNFVFLFYSSYANERIQHELLLLIKFYHHALSLTCNFFVSLKLSSTLLRWLSSWNRKSFVPKKTQSSRRLRLRQGPVICVWAVHAFLWPPRFFRCSLFLLSWSDFQVLWSFEDLDLLFPPLISPPYQKRITSPELKQKRRGEVRTTVVVVARRRRRLPVSDRFLSFCCLFHSAFAAEIFQCLSLSSFWAFTFLSFLSLSLLFQVWLCCAVSYHAKTLFHCPAKRSFW